MHTNYKSIKNNSESDFKVVYSSLTATLFLGGNFLLAFSPTFTQNTQLFYSKNLQQIECPIFVYKHVKFIFL